MFPEVGQATVRAAGAARPRGRLPAEQTCCGQMHVNTGYQREALPLVRHYVEVFERVRRGGGAVRLVRRLGAPPARDGGPAVRRRRRWPTRAEAVGGADVRAVGAAGRRARRRPTSARYYPHRVTYHPTCHSLRHAARRRQAAAAAARRARASTWSSCPTPSSAAASAARSRSRTPTPRPRCWPTRCATSLDTGAEVVHRRRLVVPDAHRRRPVPAARRRRAPCTWPRSSPRTGPATPMSQRSWACRVHAAAGVGAPARRRAVPGRGPTRAGRHPAAAQPRPAPPAPSAPSAPRWSPRCRTGRSCARPARRSRPTTMARLDRAARQLEERGRPRAAARCTGPATRPRPTGSSTGLVRATGADEVVKVKSMATQEIGLNEALDAGRDRGLRDRPGRADRAARPRHAVAHPGARDPPQPRRDPRDLPGARCRASTADADRRARARWPMAARRAPAARSSCAARVAVSGANFAVAETGTLAVRGVRGQRPDVPDPAARP